MTAPESKASEKLDNFLAQFDLEEQERILRYALDHVVPRMKKLTPLAASTPSVEPAGAGEAPSVHAEVGEAVAWLIEHHDDGRLHYLSAQGGYLCHGNIDTALRFARKEDAEALFEHYARDEGLAGNFRWREAFRIAEHMWPSPAPAAREATTALFDIPADVIEAERKVSHWFASKNVERWELGYSKARFAQPKAQAQAGGVLKALNDLQEMWDFINREKTAHPKMMRDWSAALSVVEDALKPSVEFDDFEVRAKTADELDAALREKAAPEAPQQADHFPDAGKMVPEPQPKAPPSVGAVDRRWKDGRQTTAQLFAAAQRDSDAVSVFEDGSEPGEADRAIIVVKGRENIDYLRSLCERQGLLTDKPVEPS